MPVTRYVRYKTDRYISYPTLQMHLSVIKEIALQPAFHMVTLLLFYTVMKMTFILSIMSLENLKPLH
jgi:hypothetical protein